MIIKTLKKINLCADLFVLLKADILSSVIFQIQKIFVKLMYVVCIHVETLARPNTR